MDNSSLEINSTLSELLTKAMRDGNQAQVEELLKIIKDIGGEISLEHTGLPK